ncbi:MAG: hypothetical protein ACP5JY_00775 [Candidatus Nanoarchaeia archaeon]
MPNKNTNDFGKEIKALEKQVAHLQKEITKLYLNSKTARSEAESEIKSVRKEIAKLFDSQANISAKINALSKVKNDMADILSTLSSEHAALKQDVANIKSVFDQESIESLKNSIKFISDAIADIKRTSEKNLKKFENATSNFAAISECVTSIEEENKRLQEYASELSEKNTELHKVAEEFFSQVDLINSKINSNSSALLDLTNVVENLKNEISLLENQTAQLPTIQNAINSIRATLTDLQRKVDYIEKTTVKTIVID